MKKERAIFGVMVNAKGYWEHTQWLKQESPDGGTFGDRKAAKAAIKKAKSDFPKHKYKVVKFTHEDAK